MVKEFKPDLFVVDKEATGFRGEILPALNWLQDNHDTRIVLGLRDVLDDPEPLLVEWERKGAADAIHRFYDEIWIYGLESIYNPLQGLKLSEDTLTRTHWTGYLKRETLGIPTHLDKPYVLVTASGGGDGLSLIHI